MDASRTYPTDVLGMFGYGDWQRNYKKTALSLGHLEGHRYMRQFEHMTA